MRTRAELIPMNSQRHTKVLTTYVLKSEKKPNRDGIAKSTSTAAQDHRQGGVALERDASLRKLPHRFSSASMRVVPSDTHSIEQDMSSMRVGQAHGKDIVFRHDVIPMVTINEEEHDAVIKELINELELASGQFNKSVLLATCGASSFDSPVDRADAAPETENVDPTARQTRPRVSHEGSQHGAEIKKVIKCICNARFLH
jgi:hypothetical protein